MSPESRREVITDFLTQYGTQTITKQQAEEMEDPLSEQELQTALKQMKPGKSPGHDGLSLQY